MVQSGIILGIRPGTIQVRKQARQRVGLPFTAVVVLPYFLSSSREEIWLSLKCAGNSQHRMQVTNDRRRKSVSDNPTSKAGAGCPAPGTPTERCSQYQGQGGRDAGFSIHCLRSSWLQGSGFRLRSALSPARILISCLRGCLRSASPLIRGPGEVSDQPRGLQIALFHPL